MILQATITSNGGELSPRGKAFLKWLFIAFQKVTSHSLFAWNERTEGDSLSLPSLFLLTTITRGVSTRKDENLKI